MQHIISFLLFLLSINLFGQIRGTVIDKSTAKPLQFANIFLKDQDIGATSDLNGLFKIDRATGTRIIIVSAIGYDTRVITSPEDNITIELEQKTYELPEIKVTPKKHNSKIIINPLKKITSKAFVSTVDYPWIITRFFKYLPEYTQTPIVKQLQLLTVSHIDSAIFNLRLIEADEKGGLGPDLLNKNLIISVKKGESKTLVDLSDFRVFFPKNGFFVAVEWLILDQNKDQINQFQRYHYDPLFGIVPDETNEEIWMYTKGNWHKSTLIFNPAETKKGQLAIELTLIN
jgi:hypothetical protein